MTPFRDRTQAGQLLAEKLTNYANNPDVLVLALPRGGVPVAFEVAKTLKVPMDVFLVRKLGVPNQRELAMGALASGGVCFLNEEIIRSFNISQKAIDFVKEQETKELERRKKLYRQNLPEPNFSDRTIILIDDGLATGATMRAAVIALKLHEPKRIVVAIPVAALESLSEFGAEVDEVVSVILPERLWAIGNWYENFSQTTDKEVCSLLEQANCQLSAT
ncbi:phosphoribosyl transferase [[Phormidium ambiguum] IAM M-71]|uniref:Phosphoribosyl transferase n=1 Tax=[Phormidium ambiguum] IAM M-71 TaxID=454136 RepID=A0A1U7IQH7_9CYAN|nr:phosphoribosyltransferase [Phormidium ambiguum]OKH39670.1 phosphoribosyl transferase [Phormidium ambiguum IAM M-71]